MMLIPQPRIMIPAEGVFSVTSSTAIILDMAQDDIDFATARLLQQEIEKYLSIRVPIRKGPCPEETTHQNSICFVYENIEGSQEAYRLKVTPGMITIAAGGNSGFLYGAATLIQLCRIGQGEIAAVVINDEPSFPNRGYMLDVSRGRVPKMATLKALVDKMALYKMNQLQLYMENCIRMEGFEEIWSQTDPFTAEDILELDAYCQLRCVELVPCIATFGHLYDILRSVSFGQYREIEEISTVFTWANRMRHHTINVADPESINLIKKILDNYIVLFRSSKINICCDETFDLGKGKSAHLAKEMAYGELYLFFVNKMVEYLQGKGKEVMLWGDVLQSIPEYIGNLNSNVTCLNWHYDYGAKEETFQMFSQNGLKQYVCPSVSGYSRLVNAYDLSFTNMREMALLGKKYDAAGYLNTDWGDFGGINMPALAIPCLIYGAAQSWNVADGRDLNQVDEAIALVEYGDTRKNLVKLLRDLSRQDIVPFSQLVYFRDFKIYDLTYGHNGLFLHDIARDRIMQAEESQLKFAVARCHEILRDLKQNDCASRRDSRRQMTEFYLAARGVALLQEVALVLKEREYGQKVASLDHPQEMANKLENWLADYCLAWRKVSRESELFRIREFFAHLCTILRKYEIKN